MAALEAVVGLLFIAIVVALTLLLIYVLSKGIRAFFFRRSIEGRITRKLQALTEQDNYLQELTQEIEDPETSESRLSVLIAYRELATLKQKQLSFELDALRAEQDTHEFEQRMERRAH